jgi:membrane associated rhomboid family serine protease
VPLPVRWRYKLERWRSAIAGQFHFHSQPASPRPRLCPACGALVGSTARRCHQCGASLTFSLAAANRSLSRLLPQTSPVTYSLLGLCCLIYIACLLLTIQQTGLQAPSGGLGALFGLGAISGPVLARMGASAPLPFDLAEPWRFVTAVFLHAGLLHIGFNMWVLMDIGPMVEELYGSARYLFIFVVTGIAGYLLSSFTGHFSVGASGALLGLIGVLLALTTGRHTAHMQMLRSQILHWLVYIAVLGLLLPGIDNYAHLGGFACGFLLGRVMADRQPADLTERRRANLLGWTAGLAIAASFAFMLINYFLRTGGRG